MKNLIKKLDVSRILFSISAFVGIGMVGIRIISSVIQNPILQFGIIFIFGMFTAFFVDYLDTRIFNNEE
jgi:hypothetical protein